MSKTNVGNALSLARSRAGLALTTAADRARVGRQALEDVEHGGLLPTDQELRRLKATYAASTSDLDRWRMALKMDTALSGSMPDKSEAERFADHLVSACRPELAQLDDNTVEALCKTIKTEAQALYQKYST